MKIKEYLIAPCGMNCAVCKGHLRDHNACPGCNNMKKTRTRCRMRICKKREGKFCYDCSIFPCARLSHLDNRYRTKYGMSEINNLRYIKKYGIKKFVEKENKKWISKKGVFCVHDKKYYKIN